MAKLVDIYSTEKQPTIKRRQLPLLVYDNLTMVMDLNSMGLICDNPQVRGRQYDEFLRKYKILTVEELRVALRVDGNDILNVLNQSIPCVGCRRNVERLFYQLMISGHPTLDPLLVKPGTVLTLRDDKITNPQALATLLQGHSTGIECVVESQPRWKKSRRCALHSLEAGGVRGGGWACGWTGWGGRGAWRAAWDAMRASCRDHVTLVHFTTLHDTLHNYLRKHRFCADCKTKVLRAYQLLVEEKEPQKEKGYVGALYGGIKRCLLDKHLHLQAKTEYIAHLIARAEPELLGNHRERHAKTLEIAQEEVLICLGMCVYERLQRVSLRLREEEGTCQSLAAVAVEVLYRKFETAVETKSGVSKLQLLYEEITQEEVSRQQRKEQKKLRKRKKKERQLGDSKCGPLKELDETEKCECAECQGVKSSDEGAEPGAGAEEADTGDGGACRSCNDVPPLSLRKQHNNNNNWSSSEHSADCGYSSENNGHCCETVSGSSLASSPDGSEVACSEGFCNHEHGDCKDTCGAFTMSLQDMLLDTCSSDEEHDTSYIPIEEVLEFKARRNITEKRQELRESLRNKFAQLCVNPLPSASVPSAHQQQA